MSFEDKLNAKRIKNIFESREFVIEAAITEGSASYDVENDRDTSIIEMEENSVVETCCFDERENPDASQLPSM
jgi:hypothetical protein